MTTAQELEFLNKKREISLLKVLPVFALYGENTENFKQKIFEAEIRKPSNVQSIQIWVQEFKSPDIVFQLMKNFYKKTGLSKRDNIEIVIGNEQNTQRLSIFDILQKKSPKATNKLILSSETKNNKIHYFVKLKNESSETILFDAKISTQECERAQKKLESTDALIKSIVLQLNNRTGIGGFQIAIDPDSTKLLDIISTVYFFLINSPVVYLDYSGTLRLEPKTTENGIFVYDHYWLIPSKPFDV